jgi:hypothetical protein
MLFPTFDVRVKPLDAELVSELTNRNSEKIAQNFIKNRDKSQKLVFEKWAIRSIQIPITWAIHHHHHHQRTTQELDQYDTELSCSVIELSLSTSTKRSQSQAFSLQVQYRKSLGEHCNAACGVPFLSHSVSPFVSTILARIRYANINARQTIEDDFQKSLFTKNTSGSPPTNSK